VNRRSILSTLCTGALALLAPVVALATGKRHADPTPLLRDDWLEWDSFDPRNQMNDASGTGRYIAALERVATAAARIYNEGSTLYCGPPDGKFIRHNSIDASLELEASICDLRDGYHFSFEAQKQALSPASDVSVLRALLAEARDLIANTHQEHVPGCLDCKPLRAMGTRIDNALKGDKRNA
jgi:hypothetical protein